MILFSKPLLFIVLQLWIPYKDLQDKKVKKEREDLTAEMVNLVQSAHEGFRVKMLSEIQFLVQSALPDFVV